MISAPAKINLTLHVTGRREDGYHLLDSLVVFAGIADRISAVASDTLDLTVTGPFAHGVPTDQTNLVIRAAHALRSAAQVTHGAAITLEKNLPHAAGIGSGSSDAAAMLRLLSNLWDVPPLAPHDRAVLALGADVPVCLCAPNATRLEGIGERLTYIDGLPDCAVVLVTPGVSVPTGPVFDALSNRHNEPMGEIPSMRDFDYFSQWLRLQRNDLQAPAILVAPQVQHALDALSAHADVAYATMSGSGGTCVGLVRDIDMARTIAASIAQEQPEWWVAAAPVLS